MTTQPVVSSQPSFGQPSFGLQYVKGIGPRRAEALAAAGIESLEDLVGYYPRSYIDARRVVPLREARQHLWEMVTVRGRVTTVQQHLHSHPHRVVITLRDDSNGSLQLVYFQFAEFVAKQYQPGDELIAVGHLGMFMGTPQIVHPMHVERFADSDELKEGMMLPIYPMTAAFKTARLNQYQLRKTIESVLALPEAKRALMETLPEEIIERRGLLPRATALENVHRPESQLLLNKSHYRLKYEELFFLQLRLALDRRQNALKARKGIQFDVRSLKSAIDGEQSSDGLIPALIARLPFTLTGAQLKVLTEIARDMEKPDAIKIPMHRLLQGDVGSGKTIVAILVMLAVIENGYQCALMAPTEILAEQHYNTLTQMLEGLPIRATLLVGGQKKKQRTESLLALETGEAHIGIGTHALIEDNVQFERLGLVIIDEQHRFGVAQRKALIEKAFDAAQRAGETGEAAANRRAAPDVLIMTATPIPRTLGLTLYGDLDVSIINEYPKDRKPIVTKLLYQQDHDKIYKAVTRAVKERGEQVYIVYPLVEKSEKLDLAAAKKSFEYLSTEVFTDINVGLLHGKMTPAEKHDVMMQFRDKKIDVLVSTTVIEVGIDVPNATVMIIEHAERFGLAQLHQLRGRVGRGAKQSHCILVASNKLMPRTNVYETSVLETSAQIEERSTAQKRLDTMVETNDGFRIAEVDLEIRGPGEFFGTKQSGLPVFQIADLVEDVHIMELARDDAQKLVESDPHLRAAEHSLTRSAFLGRHQGVGNFMQIG